MNQHFCNSGRLCPTGSIGVGYGARAKSTVFGQFFGILGRALQYQDIAGPDLKFGRRRCDDFRTQAAKTFNDDDPDIESRRNIAGRKCLADQG